MFEDYRVKNFPTPGIEPEPVRWKLTILATRPYWTIKKYDLRAITLRDDHCNNKPLLTLDLVIYLIVWDSSLTISKKKKP
jgi:hypothetical protein